MTGIQLSFHTYQFCLGRMASTILSFSRAYSLEPKYCMLQCRVLLIFFAWFSCLLPHASVLSCRQQLISFIVHSPHRLMSAAHGCCLVALCWLHETSIDSVTRRGVRYSKLRIVTVHKCDYSLNTFWVFTSVNCKPNERKIVSKIW